MNEKEEKEHVFHVSVNVALSGVSGDRKAMYSFPSCIFNKFIFLDSLESGNFRRAEIIVPFNRSRFCKLIPMHPTFLEKEPL